MISSFPSDLEFSQKHLGNLQPNRCLLREHFKKYLTSCKDRLLTNVSWITFVWVWQHTGDHDQTPVNQWSIGDLGWWFGILKAPLSNDPFHKGMPRIQTTNPNHQLTVSWHKKSDEKKKLEGSMKLYMLMGIYSLIHPHHAIVWLAWIKLRRCLPESQVAILSATGRSGWCESNLSVAICQAIWTLHSTRHLLEKKEWPLWVWSAPEGKFWKLYLRLFCLMHSIHHGHAGIEQFPIGSKIRAALPTECPALSSLSSTVSPSCSAPALLPFLAEPLPPETKLLLLQPGHLCQGNHCSPPNMPKKTSFQGVQAGGIPGCGLLGGSSHDLYVVHNHG